MMTSLAEVRMTSLADVRMTLSPDVMGTNLAVVKATMSLADVKTMINLPGVKTGAVMCLPDVKTMTCQSHA